MKTHKRAGIGLLAMAMVMVLLVGTSMGDRGVRQFPLGPGAHVPGIFNKDPLQPILRCLVRSDISRETLAEARDLIREHAEGISDKKEALRAAHEAYLDALLNPVLDEQELTEAENGILTLRQEYTEERFELARAIRDLLSTEEMEAVAECLE